MRAKLLQRRDSVRRTQLTAPPTVAPKRAAFEVIVMRNPRIPQRDCVMTSLIRPNSLACNSFIVLGPAEI